MRERPGWKRGEDFPNLRDMFHTTAKGFRRACKLFGSSRGMNQYEQVACGYTSKIAVLGNVLPLFSTNLTVDMPYRMTLAHICSVMRKTTAPHRSRPHPAKLLAMSMDLLSSLATSAYRISCCQQEFGRYCSE